MREQHAELPRAGARRGPRARGRRCARRRPAAARTWPTLRRGARPALRPTPARPARRRPGPAATSGIRSDAAVRCSMKASSDDGRDEPCLGDRAAAPSRRRRRQPARRSAGSSGRCARAGGRGARLAAPGSRPARGRRSWSTAPLPVSHWTLFSTPHRPTHGVHVDSRLDRAAEHPAQLGHVTFWRGGVSTSIGNPMNEGDPMEARLDIFSSPTRS